jgi:multidrug resistance efflux pump
MIKAIRKRARPDNLKNQVRAGGQSFARKLYFYCVVGVFALLGWTFMGHWFFLDAEGLVTKDRTIAATDYSARVTAIHVKPGDRLEPGQLIATLQSREIIDSIADMTMRRATLQSREAQISGRIETIRTTLPNARARLKRANEAQAQLSTLSARGLTTGPRVQDAQKELYDAQREESSISTEMRALETERNNLAVSRGQMDGAIAQIQATYNDGKILAAVAGTVGPRVPSPGQVVKSGDALAEIYRGDMFVLAYMPTSRLYSMNPNDAVRVTDGQRTFTGRIERIDGVTDALPPEFQVNFRSQDRQQLFRIAFDEAPPFPIQAKVRVSGNWSPQGLVSGTRGVVTSASETVSGWLFGGSGNVAANR